MGMDMGISAGVSGLLGGLTDAAAGVYEAKQSRKAARKAFERSIYAYQNRYQWTMEDMRKAGLNPILAAGGSPGASPTAQAAQTPDFSGVGEGVRRSFSAATEFQLRKSQLATDKATREVLDREAILKDFQSQRESYAAQSAKLNYELDKRWANTQRQLEILSASIGVSAQELEQRLRGYAEPEAAAMSRLWETGGVGGAGAKEAVKLIPGLRSVLEGLNRDGGRQEPRAPYRRR